MHFISKKK